MYNLINGIIIILSLTTALLPIKKETKDKLFLIIIGIILIFISGFRGNFSPDYGNYEHIFRTIQNLGLKDILLGNINVEIGYALINKVVGFFTSNYNILLTIIAAIIVLSYFKKIYEYSPNVSLSVLLLVTFGSYYTSFNTMRQFMVCALFMYAMEYVYSKKFLKYCLVAVALFFIHKSAIVMIPFYFILRVEWNKVRHLFYVTCFFSMYIIFLFYQKEFVELITHIFYKNYGLSGAFGINTGVPMLAIMRPVTIVIILLSLYKKINFSNIRELVWFNSSICFLLISILSINIEMFQRFTYFFLPYMIFQIPVLISRIDNRKIRSFYIISIVILIVSYSYFTNTNSVYFFVWEH
ncbi:MULTISPECIES: EpsG family protein [Vagococcus]|uniref:Capsular polysaccharide biosynthesis protein n=1 Tax=Vagococcus fluvialis bH819 TaxID=1255619 RepID=A0A1X6WLX4_9ENTE|nr:MULTISPECIES: EpsG family protein [Vagococcus]SLM85242.1 capsular polysaccharide biosynthesis protein [Vagococcus fluvialis bH819]HCM89458.1 EpsG family protein [Vagococcus sp.]